MTLCNECDKRDHCKVLCPMAEAYVKQDEVRLREKTVGLFLYANKPWPESKQKELFTPLEKKVLDALLDGKSREFIMQSLNITRHSVREHIKNIRKKRQAIRLKTEGIFMSSHTPPTTGHETKERGR